MKKRITLTKMYLLIVLLLVAVLQVPAQNQNRNISGTVVDNEEKPIAGVSVILKGTTTGVSTTADGKYRIRIPGSGQQTLQFSSIGYAAQDVIVGKLNVMNVSLESDNITLDEVVVIGYGTQRKRDVTGAITTIGDKEIEERQPVSIFDALQGAAAGVLVVSESGAPGEDGASVRIRGTSTFEGGVNPLYIVDGVPTDDISSINPNDIKSMEILKDAASAAIYGSRSANGVIIITTKTGQSGKAKIDLRYLHSFSQLSRKLPQANSADRRAFDNRNGLNLDPEAIDSVRFSRSGNYDYQDLLTRVGMRKQVDLSVSGAVPKMKYLASLGYLDEQGIIINSWSKRLTGRVNAEYQAAPRLKLSSRLTFSYQTSNAINEGKTLVEALSRPAYFVLYYPDGSYMFDNGGRKNPEAEAYYRRNINNSYKVGIYEGLEYKLAEWLTFNANINGNFSLSRTNTQNSALLTTTNPPVGTAGDRMGFSRNIIGESFFSFNKTINKSHNISAVLGMSVQDIFSEGMNISGSSLISEDIYTTNTIQVLDLNAVGTTATSNSLVGIFARASYSYKGKYLLNATIRRDGSSRFINNRWGTFPSVSLGWRFSDEKFMKWSKSFLKDAKLRASIGVTGNQNIGNYESIVRYNFGSYYYGGVSGIRSVGTFGNPDIRWEQTTQSNFGVDFTFFDGRFTLTTDYYIKKTKDLLYSSPIPSELGYDNMKVNYGSIQNKGYEVEISVLPVKLKDFTWRTSLSFSANRNKILDFATVDYIASGAWMVAKGQPIGQFYGYNDMGVYQWDESNAYASDYKTRLIPYFERDKHNNVILSEGGTPRLLGYKYPDGRDYGWDPSNNPIHQLKVGNDVLKGGDRIWENMDGNNVIDDVDRKILGSGTPKWFGSWNNNLSYKNFALSFSFYGSFGDKIYNHFLYNISTFNNNNSTTTPYIIHNSWRFPGQITPYPKANKVAVTNTNRELIGSFLEDGSYIRLRNVRFSYQLNQKTAKKIGMSNLLVYVYGNNLATWTNYTGYDPEFGGGGVLTPNKDTGRYPRKREFGLGINLNF